MIVHYHGFIDHALLPERTQYRYVPYLYSDN